MTASELKQIIALCNNGYIFAPTASEMKCANENAGIFSVSGHHIYLRGQSFNSPHTMPHKPAYDSNGVDFEAMIVSRQESFN